MSMILDTADANRPAALAITGAPLHIGRRLRVAGEYIVDRTEVALKLATQPRRPRL